METKAIEALRSFTGKRNREAGVGALRPRVLASVPTWTLDAGPGLGVRDEWVDEEGAGGVVMLLPGGGMERR